MPEFRFKIRPEGGWLTILDNDGDILTNAAVSPENSQLIADMFIDVLKVTKIRFGMLLKRDKKRKGKK
jgi:hypothetical protein